MKDLFITALLVLSSCTSTFARPQPKSSWVRQHTAARAKKAFHNDIKLHPRWSNDTGAYGPATGPSCEGSYAINAPKENIWGGLTGPEASSVASWLFAQPELNLTASEDAGDWDNSILLIELMVPNKTDALAYLDGSAPPPVRYAHARLDMRASDSPEYAEILVGPLPIDNATTTWSPLEYPYTRKTGGRVRNLDADSSLNSEWIYSIGASVADITLDLWGGTATGHDNDTLDIWGIDPLWQDDGRIKRWDTFWNFPMDEFDAETLLPLGLYFKSDVTGRDSSKWKLEGWLYNNIFYETTEAFRAAYFSPGFEKLGPNVEGDWARTDQQGTPLPYDTQTPPIMVAPSGNRFAVDAVKKYVQWMDWSFYVGFNRDTGITLFDISYKGQRIIYELGLQEALAHYAGNDPVQSGTSYLDSFYGFGPYAFQLVKGYDCPAYATYLNTSFYVSESTHNHVDSLCLFEYDADYPMQRHSQSKYVSVRKNVYFTLRSVSTVGNYDYAFSYTFSQDGSIGVEVRASGYIQSAYYANNEDYGWQIHDALSGSMHDHVLNWKIDMDILGQENSLMLLQQVPVSKTYPWSDGKARNTMQVTRRYIESEDESRLFWGDNGNTQFIVVNQDVKNKYGNPRGYRIMPSTGTIHLTVQNSSNLANAANWAGYDLQVTRQHDTEPRAAYPYNSQDVHNPVIDFDDFFNSESLVQEDLIVFVNIGMHHVPHTGDLPNTVFTTAHSGIQLMPLNYFEGDVGVQTVNMVRINYGGGNTSQVLTFGQGTGDAVCAAGLDYTPIDADLADTYKGDVVVRKFPEYDPNDPYYETDAIV